MELELQCQHIQHNNKSYSIVQGVKIGVVSCETQFLKEEEVRWEMSSM